jgi:hypothetical protein
MRQGGSYGKIKLHLRRDASRYRSGRSREARPWRVLRARAAVGTPVQWRPMRRRPRGLGAVFVGAWWRILATVLSLGLHANISRSAPRGVCRVIAGAPSRRGAGVCVTARRRRSKVPETPPWEPPPGGVRAVLKPVVALAADGPATRRHEQGLWRRMDRPSSPRSILDPVSGAGSAVDDALLT